MVTDRQTRAMLAICTAILVAAALYFARSIFAPLAFALFMVAIVWPLQSTLQRKLPQFVALFIRHLPACGHFCGVLLELLVGHPWCIHRRARHYRRSHALRAVSLQPLDRNAVRRENAKSCLQLKRKSCLQVVMRGLAHLIEEG
jgi:hypothetical protein